MRHTGIDVIGDVPWGTHFCQFYETNHDLIETLVPYFKAGLEANEFCMWVTSEPLRGRAARAALKAAVPDLDGRIRRGQIEIIDYKKWYVRSGKFSAEEVLAGWADKLEAALAKGYDGLRLSGNTFWLEKADWEDFRKYEEAVDNIIGRRRMMAMCTYSLQKCGASEIIDVVANHEFALIKRQGRWEIIESVARKQAEEKIRRGSLKYSKVLETAQSGFWVFDMAGKLLEVNDSYCRMSGYSREELLNMQVSSIEAKETPEDVMNHIRFVREHGRHEFETRHRRKDGTEFDAEVRASYLDIEGGRLVVFIWDVSKRKEMERALRESESRLRLLAETAGRLLEAANPQEAVNELCQKAMEHLDCDVFFNFLVDETAKRLRLNASAGIPEEVARQIEWLDYGVAVCGCVARDGVRIVAADIPTTRDPRTDFVRSLGIQAHACHPLIAHGKVIGTLSFGTRRRTRFADDELAVMKTIADQVAIAIERIRDSRELKHERDFSATVLDTAGVLVSIVDKDGRISRFNKACQAASGYSEAEVLGRVFWEFLVPSEDAPGFREVWKSLAAGGPTVFRENRWLARDGSLRLIAWTTTPIPAPDGGFEYVIGSGVDITERQRAEESIRYQAFLLGQVDDGIIGADADSRITYWNKGAERIYGYTEAEVLGKTTRELLRPTYGPGEREKISEDLQLTGTSRATIRTKHKDGTLVMAEVDSTRLTGPSGTTAGYVVVYRNVTERQRAEEELRRTREHLENLIDYANAPIIVWGPDFQITRFNHAFERLTELKAEEVIGQPLDSLFPEASREESLAHIKRTLAGERWETVEIPILRTDGSIRTVLWNSANIYEKDGTTISATIAQGQDITDRKRMEEETRRLASFPMLSPQPVVEVDEQARVCYANPAAQTLFPDLKLLGRQHPWLADWPTLALAFSRPETNIPAREVKVGERWYHQNMYFVADIQRLRIYGTDITPLKAAEKGLRQRGLDLQQLTETLEQRVLLRTSELEEANELLQAEVTHSYFIEADLKQQQESLQTVIDNIPVMLCFFDSSGRARLANREFKKLLGWSEKETELKAFGRGSGQAGLPESQGQEAGGIPGWRNLRVRTSAGAEMDTSWAAVRLSDGGRIDIGLDMRERREAEKERLRLAAAVEQAWEGMAITDSTGIISYVNSAFEETTGAGRAGLVGRRYFDILGGQADLRELAAAAQKSVEAGASWSAHLSRKRLTDQSCELDIRITPIREGSGKIINHLVVERDVTGEYRLQQHLRQAQKLEALGTLAGGIAHDFNNILNPIFINTELVLLDAALDDESRRELELGLKAAERGRDLVRQIITFSRQKERERKPSKVGPVVMEALKFLRSTLAATIEIREHLEPETGFIMADPSQIHQIIMNLCNNSAHAMREKGGILAVELAEVDVDAEMALRHPDIEPGPFLRLTVTDTGTGMTPEVIERAFDPFFTTKRPGEGSGMGLAVVHGIVRDYAGAVTIYSEIGKGTTLNIFLPRVPSKDVAAHEVAEILPQGRQRILLVDDEQAQVQSIGNMLKRLGHEVVSKTDPGEALESFRQDPSRFDLVITDQTMPKLTGAHLAEEILRLRPGLPVILCTGFSEKVDANAAHGLGIAGFLMKPFSIREMTAAINQALKKA